jgi:hypothetical protein
MQKTSWNTKHLKGFYHNKRVLFRPFVSNGLTIAERGKFNVRKRFGHPGSRQALAGLSIGGQRQAPFPAS